ncbi:hypothetical protein Cni_G19592 [Canna indica]|uniref:RNase H type-1 domain-containing protein n=1 Tax=Canna indica TaxID=4628 RepID=A0AAQ3KKS3_9LILI|nr:hypothetical protein Cni_G19592 [Canna indica]
MSGLGFRITDNKGNKVVDGVNSKVTHSPLMAEIWSIWISLVKAKELGLKNVYLYSDSLQAINLPNKKQKPPWFLHGLILDILSCSKEASIIEWKHIKREFNTAAHNLAKEGLIRNQAEQSVQVDSKATCGVNCINVNSLANDCIKSGMFTIRTSNFDVNPIFSLNNNMHVQEEYTPSLFEGEENTVIGPLSSLPFS